jgi:cupin 2 domain-containing protein
MNPQRGNLYTDIPARRDAESFLELVSSEQVRIERIVSSGQSTAAGEWLDQDRPEWVVLLQGAAALRFEGDVNPHVMQVGDYVKIAAHRRHRVEWTSPDPPTIWLAVHYAAPRGDEI